MRARLMGALMLLLRVSLMLVVGVVGGKGSGRRET